MTEAHTLQDTLGNLARFGDRPAVIALQKEGAQTTSYEELDRMAGRFAAGLRRREVAAGDRIAFLAGGSTEWIMACLGVLRAGAIPVPLDVQFDDDALVHVLTDSEPRLLITGQRQAARLDKLDFETSFELVLLDGGEDDDRGWKRFLEEEPVEGVRPEPDDDAVLFYTSGTTGPPKGVPLTQDNLAAQIETLLQAELVTQDDRLLLPLPLHHVYPFVVGTLTPLALGLPIVLPWSLTGPQIVRALNEEAVTIVLGVPRLYRALFDGIVERTEGGGRLARLYFRGGLRLSMLLRRRLGLHAGRRIFAPIHREFGPHLRMLACGGSPLKEELAWKLEALGWRVAVGYGLTETSPLLTINPPPWGRIGTVGRAVEGVELRVEPTEKAVETEGRRTGEILARGRSVFRGYRNLPDKTEEVFTEDGWFRTGDMGFIDEDDYLHIVGRTGTVLITEGGEKVQPDEVEDAYAEHPAIREIGVLDDSGKIVALIVPETGAAEAEDLREEIARAVDERGAGLRSYQRLADFRITREALPRTRLGKIQRHKLRERYDEAGSESRERAEPIGIDEMTSDDRALLDDPAAARTWEYLAERFADRRLTPDASMRLDLDVDSLEWMNLSLALRREAEIDLEEEAIGRIETVRDLLEEAVEASAAGEGPAGRSPLEDPEASLSEDQRQHLEPPGPLGSFAAGLLYYLNRTLMRLLFRLEVEGVDRLPEGPVIITPNHASYLDPPAVAAALPRERVRHLHWGGWTGVMFANPLMRGISRLAGVMPIDPQKGATSSLAFGAAVLDRERNLVWFPEGQRSRDGHLQPFRPGIGLLLENRPQATVIPTAIEGAWDALPPHRRFPRLHRIRVTFGEPLRTDDLREEGQAEDGHKALAESLRKHVAAGLQEPEGEGKGKHG